MENYFIIKLKINLSLCGEEPFKGDNNEEIYRKILKCEFDSDTENYKRLSTNAKVKIIYNTIKLF